jgi:hypothetical protein
MHLTGVSPLVGIQWLTFWTIENGALIDCRFNGQRQAEPPEIARRAQGMSIGFRRDRGEKEFPDLALEIALTIGGLSKLGIQPREPQKSARCTWMRR